MVFILRTSAVHLKTQLALFLLLFGACSAGGPSSETSPQALQGKLSSQSLAPRGGTTNGPTVDYALEEDLAWERIGKAQSSKEKDRTAILAMVGEFQASFEFAETGLFSGRKNFTAPYQSWATEKVYLLKESEDFISLQHLLVMHFVVDGKIEGPFVMKHWRQDWSWQATSIFSFTGNKSWTKRELSSSERDGKWLQEVFHVDDSPRYSSLGRWEHYQNFSRWLGEQTARPLPRRERTSGLDYKVLVGSNTQTISKNKWLHEQHNYKCQGISLDNCQASEVGVNSYRRITDYDFKEGDQYIKDSAAYWSATRSHWKKLFKEHKVIKLKELVENKQQFEMHFENVEKSKGDAVSTINSFIELAY